MPTYAYRTLGNGVSSGKGLGATIDAPDRASALRELIRRGETPLSLELAGQPAPAQRPPLEPGPSPVTQAAHGGASRSGGGIGFGKKVMTLAEFAAFTRELATALQAGLPLVPALRTLGRQGRTASQRRMLDTIIEQVEHGRSLGDAAAAWGKPFGDLTVSMIRAGEASGKLPEVLTQAANLLDRDLKLRRSILSATFYPMILLSLISVAIVVVVTVIVPRVLKNVPKNFDLPWPTQVVQGVAQFFAGYWWLIVPLVLAAIWGARRAYEDPGVRLRVDTWLLRVPVLGRLLRDVAVARFTRTLGTLTTAGIPVIQALKITRGTLGNRAMERVIDEVCEQVAGGKTIADPMERSGHFPPMLVQIVNLGERSGRLDELLGQAAGAFEDRTEMSVKLFTAALPPILVVISAGAVGFIILAIIMPLLQLQEAAAGR